MSEKNVSHTKWMKRAIFLASLGKNTTSPNPMVGAVILDKNGKLISEGFHYKAGMPHAEAMAFNNLKKDARGGSIYVNLEGRPQISSQVKFPIDGVNHSWTFLNKLSKLFNLSLYSDHNDLREKMFLNHEHLSYINQIQLSKKNKNKKSKFKFSNQEMKSNISNFYMTDSVSRNSKIMSDCSLAFLKETNVT